MFNDIKISMQQELAAIKQKAAEFSTKAKSGGHEISFGSAIIRAVALFAQYVELILRPNFAALRDFFIKANASGVKGELPFSAETMKPPESSTNAHLSTVAHSVDEFSQVESSLSMKSVQKEGPVVPHEVAPLAQQPSLDPSKVELLTNRLKSGQMKRMTEGMCEGNEEFVIRDALENELSLGNSIEQVTADLSELTKGMGINYDELPETQQSALLILYLLNRNCPDDVAPFITNVLNGYLFEVALSLIKKDFANEIGYQSHAAFKLDAFLSLLGIDKNQFDESQVKMLQDLIFVQSEFKSEGPFSDFLINQIDSIISHEAMIQHFDDLCYSLQTDQLTDKEIEDKLTHAMGVLNFLSTNMPWNEIKWDILHAQYNGLLELKADDEHFSSIKAKVFNQFSTLVEDGFIAYHMSKEGGSLEHVTQALYGRTPEAMETVKTENRQRVVLLMEAMARHVEETGELTIEMLERLHLANNTGIVPGYASEMRSEEGKLESFGQRIGLFPQDIEPAVQGLLDRVNKMLKLSKSKNPFSKLRWSIEAAKFHNELLDIHPFLDRNGSTSLLFLEFLMMFQGHKPSPKRNKDFYSHLSNVLRNPIATAVIVYEQFKIAHVSGYYKHESLDMNKEEYEKALEFHLGKSQIPEEEEHNVGKLKQIKEKIKNALGVQKKEEQAAS